MAGINVTGPGGRAASSTGFMPSRARAKPVRSGRTAMFGTPVSAPQTQSGQAIRDSGDNPESDAVAEHIRANPITDPAHPVVPNPIYDPSGRPARAAPRMNLSVQGQQFGARPGSPVTRYGLFANGAPQPQAPAAPNPYLPPPMPPQVPAVIDETLVAGNLPGNLRGRAHGAASGFAAAQPQRSVAPPAPVQPQTQPQRSVPPSSRPAAPPAPAPTFGGFNAGALEQAKRAKEGLPPTGNGTVDGLHPLSDAEKATQPNRGFDPIRDATEAIVGGVQAFPEQAGSALGNAISGFKKGYDDHSSDNQTMTEGFQQNAQDVGFQQNSLVGDVGQNWTAAMDPAAWEQMAQNRMASQRETSLAGLNDNERRLNARAARSGFSNTGGARSSMYNAREAAIGESDRNIFNDTLGQQMDALKGASQFATTLNAQDQAQWQTLFAAGDRAKQMDFLAQRQDNPSAMALLADLMGAAGQAAGAVGDAVGGVASAFGPLALLA